MDMATIIRSSWRNVIRNTGQSDICSNKIWNSNKSITRTSRIQIGYRAFFLVRGLADTHSHLYSKKLLIAAHTHARTHADLIIIASIRCINNDIIITVLLEMDIIIYMSFISVNSSSASLSR